MIIFDRLYGEIKISDSVFRLLQTRELERLRHVSLSAVPPWAVPAGICATKFEHSLGTAHLAGLVKEEKEFRDASLDLYFAALAHDIGTPPFSHTSEHFQRKVLGKNHEEFAEDVIDGSEFAREVRLQGGSVERILRFVRGEEKPLGALINGFSDIDLDNLDNSPRYGLSMGVIRRAHYMPETLACSFRLCNGKLAFIYSNLVENNISGFALCRKNVYNFVYSHHNLCPAMMTFRALDFAMRENELKNEYFLMTDIEAFEYLRTQCNVRTRILAERMRRWNFYYPIFCLKTPDTSDYMKELSKDSDNRGIVADEIASLLNIPPEDVCVYIGKSRSVKEIRTPIIGIDGREHEFVAELGGIETYWIAHVYVASSGADKQDFVRKFMMDRLKLS